MCISLKLLVDFINNMLEIDEVSMSITTITTTKNSTNKPTNENNCKKGPNKLFQKIIVQNLVTGVCHDT